MNDGRDGAMTDRRSFLKGLSGAALSPAIAFAQADDPLQQLIRENQRSDMGQGFDSASRTIQMPKSSLPTLSPATVQHTELAISRYEQIVAAGGWPTVPPTDRLRLGARNPAVTPLRARLTVAGDLDPSAVENDIYDSYVEAAVRRFQVRHGLSGDGRSGLPATAV